MLIADQSRGATWQSPTGIELRLGWSASVTVGANSPGVVPPGPTSQTTLIRFLLVAEVTEIFVATRNNGWFGETSLFSNADEGSKGEGLSRFLGLQFLLATGLGSLPPSIGLMTPLWFKGGRPDAVNSAPDDDQQDAITDCTTAFLWYLNSQLGYGINAIIDAGVDTLSNVHQKLTGRSDAWAAFSGIVGNHYPVGFKYNPLSDNLFPVPNLVQLFPPNQITCGYSGIATIVIDRQALAEDNIQLVSDDPASVQVPNLITIPVGKNSTTVTIATTAVAGPFPTKIVNVRANYAGKSLTMPVEVVSQRIVEVTLLPDSVICGHNANCTNTLDNASTQGVVQVNLLSDASDLRQYRVQWSPYRGTPRSALP